MWSNRVWPGLVLAAYVAGASYASADTRLAVADTYVSSKNADTNYGNQTTSEVGREMGGSSPNVTRSLLHFDLTGLPVPDAIPRVTLRVFINSTTTDPLGLALVLSLLATPFDESVVTWNNQPAVLPTPTENATMNTPPGDWFAIDVTDLVRAARAGAFPDDLYLRIAAVDETTNDDQNFTFLTREAGAETAPQLDVGTAAPAPTLSGPMSIVALFVLTAIAVGAFRRRVRR